MLPRINTFGNALFSLLFVASAVALALAVMESVTPWRINGLAILATLAGLMFLVSVTASALRLARVRAKK